MQFDESSFAKYFVMTDGSTFEQNGVTVPLKDEEIVLSSIKIVEKEFITEVLGAL